MDIPQVKLEITEYQAEIVDCACGQRHVAPFPDAVTAPVQYGTRLKSQIIYFMNYQSIPYDRLSELMEDLYGRKISLGTVYNCNYSGYQRLEDVEEKIKNNIWKSNFQFDGDHALCNSHHLRELQYIEEQYDQAWPVRMKQLLLEIKGGVDTAKVLNCNNLGESVLEEFEKLNILIKV